ncbi:hypothetical protein AAY473_034258 [Plecturocebus cupreus]
MSSKTHIIEVLTLTTQNMTLFGKRAAADVISEDEVTLEDGGPTQYDWYSSKKGTSGRAQWLMPEFKTSLANVVKLISTKNRKLAGRGSSDLGASASQVDDVTGVCHQVWLIFVFLTETRFHHVGQTGLELLASSDPPASASQSAEITSKPARGSLSRHGFQVHVYPPGWIFCYQKPPRCRRALAGTHILPFVVLFPQLVIYQLQLLLAGPAVRLHRGLLLTPHVKHARAPEERANTGGTAISALRVSARLASCRVGALPGLENCPLPWLRAARDWRPVPAPGGGGRAGTSPPPFAANAANVTVFVFSDVTESGVRDQPGQYGETPSLLKIEKKKEKKLARHAGTCLQSQILGSLRQENGLKLGGRSRTLWEAKASRLFKPRSSRQAWVTWRNLVSTKNTKN